MRNDVQAQIVVHRNNGDGDVGGSGNVDGPRSGAYKTKCGQKKKENKNNERNEIKTCEKYI